MAAVGDLEVKTQRHVVALFRDRLGYEYLGDWGAGTTTEMSRPACLRGSSPSKDMLRS